MGYIARPTTGASGMQLMGGFDIYNLKHDPSTYRVSPWAREIGKMKRAKFGKLLDTSFDLLARHVMKEQHLLASVNCLYGYAGKVRVINVNGRQYREWAGAMHNKTYKQIKAEAELEREQEASED